MDNGSLFVSMSVPAKPFYADRTDKALHALHTAGYTPLFMPQLADARIGAPEGSPFFSDWYTAPSIRATGRTRQGNAVVVYGHIPNYLSDPKNITAAIDNGLLRNGAAEIPRDEFQKLVDADGIVDAQGNRAVWVIDYASLQSAPSGIIKVSEALRHPQTIPFLGGETRAAQYLRKHEQVYGKTIGNRYSDDLDEKPRGRLLFLGYNSDFSLDGYGHLYDNGRFLGVRSGAPQNFFSLDNMLSVSRPFVPEAARLGYQESIRALFP